MLVVRRLYDWSYEETERFVSDSLVLRQFCRLYLESAPDDTILIRWATLIGPETLEQLNDHIVALARRFKVTRGRKLGTDGTMVETNIHHPTDSSLLSDGVRVISRLIQRAKEVVGEGIQEATAPGLQAPVCHFVALSTSLKSSYSVEESLAVTVNVTLALLVAVVPPLSAMFPVAAVLSNVMDAE